MSVFAFGLLPIWRFRQDGGAEWISMFGLVTVIAASVVYATPAPENQVQQAPVAINAVQRQADRAGKDRWTRSETVTESSVEEEEEAESSSSKANVPKRSRRELNGDLHLGDW